MQDKEPLRQGLAEKLREAGFAPPEPLQKQGKRRDKKDAGKRQPSKEIPMSNPVNNQAQQPQPQPQQSAAQPAPQQQQQQPAPQVPGVPLDPREARVLDNFDRIANAMANRLEGKAAPTRFQGGEVATLAAKTGIVVVGVAAGTAAVLGIKKLLGGSSDPSPAS